MYTKHTGRYAMLTCYPNLANDCCSHYFIVFTYIFMITLTLTLSIYTIFYILFALFHFSNNVLFFTNYSSSCESTKITSRFHEEQHVLIYRVNHKKRGQRWHLAILSIQLWCCASQLSLRVLLLALVQWHGCAGTYRAIMKYLADYFTRNCL